MEGRMEGQTKQWTDEETEGWKFGKSDRRERGREQLCGDDIEPITHTHTHTHTHITQWMHTHTH